MGLSGTTIVDWILPGLLVMTWVVLAVVRRVSGWFFGLAVCAALLCFPAGVAAGRRELASAYCSPETLCFSANEVDWWMNGVLGLFTVVGLAILSGVLKMLDPQGPQSN